MTATSPADAHHDALIARLAFGASPREAALHLGLRPEQFLDWLIRPGVADHLEHVTRALEALGALVRTSASLNALTGLGHIITGQERCETARKAAEAILKHDVKAPRPTPAVAAHPATATPPLAPARRTARSKPAPAPAATPATPSPDLEPLTLDRILTMSLDDIAALSPARQREVATILRTTPPADHPDATIRPAPRPPKTPFTSRPTPAATLTARAGAA